MKRCSGFLCSNDFYERNGRFKNYPDDTRYMSITCGGCCGNLLSVKIENFNMRIKKAGIDKKDVSIHFASCVCLDNSHKPPCPFMNRMKKILERKGYYDVISGTHISKTAEQKRQAGIYKS